MNITVHISQTKQLWKKKELLAKGENILSVITRMRSCAILKVQKHEIFFPWFYINRIFMMPRAWSLRFMRRRPRYSYSSTK